MTDVVVVADATPLLSLARIGRLDLLRAVARRILTTPAVWRELTENAAAPGAREIAAASWIEVRAPSAERVAIFAADLDDGEAEALALAQETAGALLLVDERKARRVARSAGLRHAGTLGVLVRAKRAGLLTALAPEIDALVKNGFHVKPSVVARVLAEVGE